MKNIEKMRGQLKSMGAMFDWGHEVVTCHPDYYKWTQWFFLKFLENDLAYRKNSPVDWCPTCNTTLAREQVWGDDRHCERCRTPVIKKSLDQWFFRVTKYAEELLDFSKIQWPERVVKMQEQWIGRSEGAEITFVSEQNDPIVVFTTRPDTLYGATFLVLAPEHPLVQKLTPPSHKIAVDAYVAESERKTEIDRLTADREKSGVFTGAYAVHPLSGEKIPIWIADYVLVSYGTGAIMAVPAHDERDFAFAKKYGLEIKVVITPEGYNGAPLEEAYPGHGKMIHSGSLDGMPSEEGKGKIIALLEGKGCGRASITYRLRDWLVSRQRYWGAPIPIIYCEKCGAVPVLYGQLPVLLPEDAEFLPTGESPLKKHAGFLNAGCPKCGGAGQRETDTMDTFLCSSWYQYAYLSPYYKDSPFSREEGGYWLPVDQYTGGIEHATMHLLYTRFFTKAMRDIGQVDFDEPMLNLYNQGIILGEDSEKMSKSRGNVVSPDDLVNEYGADVIRAYLMFIGPWDEGGPWNSRGIVGVQRFLQRSWNIVLEPAREKGTQPAEEEVLELKKLLHQTIKTVTGYMESFKFNTLLATLMEMNNAMHKIKSETLAETSAWKEAIRYYILMLAPLVPHIAEELWERTGGEGSVHKQSWPAWNEKLTVEDKVCFVVQVNGKLRDRLEVPANFSKEEACERAQGLDKIKSLLDGKEIVKTIFVPGKLLNFVVK
jgi:leucyl-tRNA synthetase